MPDPNADRVELTCRVGVEIDQTLDVVLVKDGVKRVYQLRPHDVDSGTVGLIGTVLTSPTQRAWLYRQMLTAIDKDEREGWVREDNG